MDRDPRWCRECRNAYHLRWHWKHRGKCVESMRRRRVDDPQRHKAYQKAYDARHPGRRLEQGRQSRRKHSAEITEKSKRRYWSNPEAAREYVRRWRQENLEKCRQRGRELHQMHKARKNAECRRWKRSRFFYERARKWETRHGYSIPPLLLWGIWKRQRGRCALTGRRLDGRSIRGASLDHIIARINGGTGHPENLRWLCYEANIAKGMLTDEQLFGLCGEILKHRRKVRPMLSDVIDGMQHLAGVML